MNPEAQLRWEADRRLSTSVAAIAAGMLTLIGGLVGALAYKDFPDDGPAAPVERAHFYADHVSGLLASAAVVSSSVILLAIPLRYLFIAIRARRPEMPKIAGVLAVASPIIVGLTTLAQQVAVSVSTRDWANNNPGDYFKARDATQTDLIIAIAILREAALLALGFAFVMICLNAMRVGLLTRFMGILGIIVGVLFVIPIGAPVPVVEAFWLVALGYLIGGRWPRGVPPAWITGEAVPWPSQQELREEREREAPPPKQPKQPPPAGPAAPEPAVATAEGPAHPSSKKRKRKRRN
jgi:hypothetical protein